MANMSYCRFENTVADLADCERALPDFDNLSESEKDAAREMLELCHRIASDYDLAAFA